ncbi:multidrug resistance protein, MATE family [Microbulbifer donghaiensis]|uniref:Multidrug resistance protein, MATE family n=1 Tax=Microbulbifer donghaiensis TaxID=494016 RepID=A0A1M5AUA0_9GAMM|nr:MATE family efflux transporter [Microbulbifer donghaiensis]SHF33803.1 multidrug resistance protein, MATE family [Microbulbifer donghaiensis]
MQHPTVERSSYQRVWSLAWPMILSNISVPLLGAVDTAILGHLDSPEFLSGVAIGASVMSMLLWAFGFLRMGTTGLVARTSGSDASDDSGAAWLLRALSLALVLGLALLLLASPLLATIVQWMNASASAAPHALAYLQIRLLSAPLALANFALLGFFIGRQDSRAPLFILLAANLLNILLDFALIMGLGFGARGAAMATVCADIFAFAFGLHLLKRVETDIWQQLARNLYAADFFPWRRAAPWLELLRINGDLFVRTCLLLLTLTFFTAQGAAQGDAVLAANAILLQLLMMTSYALDGFAHATEALVGEAVGKKSSPLFYSTVRSASIWALGSASAITLVLVFARDWILPLFTDMEAVLSQAHGVYWWLCALPLLAVWSYQLDGVFIGAGKSRQMRDTMFVATVLIFFPSWWLTRDWGNHGVWFSLFLWTGARSLGLLIYFRVYTLGKSWM